MPGAIDPSLPVILVEGEMDALSCAAIGVKNVFSTGGTQGLTGELIREHLIGAAEIVFLFDGDEKGRSACGLDPVGDGGATAPQALRREGYQGMVRLAELPHDSEKSDPDSLAATGRRDVILLAIAEAAEYEPPAFKRRSGSPREEQQQTNIWKTWEDIPVTMLDDILSRIKKDNIDEGGAGAFITACIKACPHKDARQRLLAWGARTEELDAKSDVSAYYLLEICDRYGLPRSLRVNIENALVPPAELITENPWDVKINMKNIITSEEARQFVFKGDVQSAAIVVTRSAKGTLIYVESQKKWYAYNGLTWNREPDPAYLIYNILLEIINHFLKNKLHDKKNLWKLLLKIGERRFREDVTKDIRRSYGIHMEDIHFDSAAIRETITLADCVMDFRGNTVVYRNARPEEFRHRFLRYTREQVEETGYAQYMNFMEGNFKDPDTLETLLYYLSLVGSRNTGYKKIGVFIGPKHTGKSATLETLREIYYPSAVSVNSEVFIHFGKRFQNADAPSPTLAGMEGAMLAYISESQKGARFNTEILKRVSGGDEIKARKLYEDERGYLSTSQFIIASNYSPSFDADDSAFIDRLVIIPFKVQHKPGEKDTKQIDYLKNSLKEEFPGIVRVYAERYIKLKVELGGNIPLSEECVNYMNNYVEEQKSDIDLFLQDNFETGLSGEHFVTVADIYNRYLLYNDIPEDEKSRAPLDQKKLTYIIRRSGIEFKNYRKKRVGAKVVSIIQGIALKPWDPDQAPGGGLAIETASPSTGAEKEENPFIGGKDD
jgi:hypothetical protein